MPRIRTVKPEFFTSPSTASVDFPVRIFYQALWCWADDFGIGETNINGLLGFAFCDSDQIWDEELRGFRAVSARDLRGFCADVAQHYGVNFYTVRGRHYYAISTWEKHQKLERRNNRRKNPTPDDPDAVPDQRIYGCADFAPHSPRKIGANPRKSGAGTGEQGNRGTGEKKACPPVQTEPHSDEADDAGEPPRTPAVAATRGADLVRANIPDIHPGATLTSLRIQASELLHTGTAPDIVAQALQLWCDKPGIGNGRTILASLCSEVIKTRTTPRRSTTDQRITDAQALKAKYLAAENSVPALTIAPMGELA